jgi:serine/threonine protein kinase
MAPETLSHSKYGREGDIWAVGCTVIQMLTLTLTLLNLSLTLTLTLILGTPYFMAPETLSHSKYGRKGDIWAVGCTVIQMLTGEPPWKDKNLQVVLMFELG